MKIPKKYVIETMLYGLTALIGIISTAIFLIQMNWFIVMVSIAVILVSLDNFFCGTRFGKVCSIKTKHYIIPPFLKRK